jgi:hypothetical protein
VTTMTRDIGVGFIGSAGDWGDAICAALLACPGCNPRDPSPEEECICEVLLADTPFLNRLVTVKHMADGGRLWGRELNEHRAAVAGGIAITWQDGEPT